MCTEQIHGIVSIHISIVYFFNRNTTRNTKAFLIFLKHLFLLIHFLMYIFSSWTDNLNIVSDISKKGLNCFMLLYYMPLFEPVQVLRNFYTVNTKSLVLLHSAYSFPKPNYQLKAHRSFSFLLRCNDTAICVFPYWTLASLHVQVQGAGAELWCYERDFSPPTTVHCKLKAERQCNR